MIGVDVRGLIDRCNTLCTRVLNRAAQKSVAHRHYEVTVEHFLLACLTDRESDAFCMLSHAEVNIPVLTSELERALTELRSGNGGRPAFSPALVDVLEAGWLISSIELKSPALRTGGVLLAFLRRPHFYGQGDYLSLVQAADVQTLLRAFPESTRASAEHAPMQADDAAADRDAGGTGGAQSAQGQAGESFVARFCEDFTARAREGRVDPVFGREQEIRQMVDILARRRKNNPILVGEPGVGKTAVMEGLALRIHLGDVPDTLRNTTLLSLDMGLLEAGASMRGEFERRLKGVLDEIKASPKPVILFIDEAHLLVGAGSSTGGSDAANLMKPALARGEIRTCAATTWKEYKKYFEKDPALARRFQPVRLDEPSVETATLILRGLKQSYEAAHKVLVRDEALCCAADYAARYITGRFLPDKAVDLLDTACARVRVNLAARPAALEDCERAMQALQREQAALVRDADEGVACHKDRLQEIAQALASQEAQAQALTSRWQREKALADEVLAAREALESLRAEEKAEAQAGAQADGEARETQGQHDARPAADAAAPDTAQATADADAALPLSERMIKARERMQAARRALAEAQGDEPLLSVEVTADVIAQVVADWTGIPVGKVARDQAAQVANLQATLASRIRGQDAALASIAEGIQAAKAGLNAPSQPLGVFLLTGPSGVGKTETGLALADALFGNSESVITVNMSEFQERHTVSRLVGSPPGYVGYGEGGLLTEAVRRRPYAVVLLDEVEKAHADVLQLFYQVFDKGVLTDGEGTTVSFRNTVILLTSNLGSDITQHLCAQNPALSQEELVEALRPVLTRHFQPALLARMRIVPYRSLASDIIADIANLKLAALAERVQQGNGMSLTWDAAVPGWLAARCTTADSGARTIDYVLAGTILPVLARNILRHMADACPPDNVHLSLAGEELVLDFSAAADGPDSPDDPAGQSADGPEVADGQPGADS